MRHRQLPLLMYAILAFLLLAPASPADLVSCAAFTPVTCPDRNCPNEINLAGRLPGASCIKEGKPGTIRGICRTDDKDECCSCETGVLACTPVLQDPNTLQILIQSDARLSSVTTMSTRNVNTALYGLPSNPNDGTTDVVQFMASKIDTSQSASVELQACDESPSCILCDPIITPVTVQSAGQPARSRFAHLPEAASKVTIANGSPGVRNLLVWVNGEIFRLNNLRDGESRTLDVAAAMKPGTVNVISLAGRGRPKAMATVMIHD